MRQLTFSFCLILLVFLGGVGQSWSTETENNESNAHSNLKPHNIIKYPSLDITNYPSAIHGGVRATWGITQARDGRIYFANTHGILVYDGESWRIVEAKDAALGRSITTDSDGYIPSGMGSPGRKEKWKKQSYALLGFALLQPLFFWYLCSV